VSVVKKIITYLNVNFISISNTYNRENFFEYRRLLLNQKRGLLILYNLMKVS